MPAKRKAASTDAAASRKAPRSSLAREHNITASEEAEIKEAWGLFCEPLDGEKEGVLPIGDVRRAMVALGIPPTSQSELAEFVAILDPDDDGYATYAPFVAICALKLHARADEAGHEAEVDEAFALFTAGGPHSHDGGGEAVITLAHLYRIAATLKMDLPEHVLKDMILEANGSAGITPGVNRAQFESVMRRAGVWK